jgi:DNA replication and repair protein RecF
VELLRRDGQAVITTTELAHVPGGEEADVARLAITPGADLQEADEPGEDAREAS